LLKQNQITPNPVNDKRKILKNIFDNCGFFICFREHRHISLFVTFVTHLMKWSPNPCWFVVQEFKHNYYCVGYHSPPHVTQIALHRCCSLCHKNKHCYYFPPFNRQYKKTCTM